MYERVTLDEFKANLNLPLLRDVVGWAVKDAKALDDKVVAQYGTALQGSWDQGKWCSRQRNGVCTTTYCIAGQAATEVGVIGWYVEDEGKDENGHRYVDEAAIRVYPAIEEEVDGKFVLTPDMSEEGELIRDAAVRALGITNTEADALFHGDNTIADVILVARNICDLRDLDLGIPMPDPEKWPLYRYDGYGEGQVVTMDDLIRWNEVADPLVTYDA